MKLIVQHIGIIEESLIELNGLTILTGKNNSGKTTVGKILYSLVDGMNDLTRNYRLDRERFIYRKLAEVASSSDAIHQLVMLEGDEKDDILADYPLLRSFIHEEFLNENQYFNVETYAAGLLKELEQIKQWVSSGGTKYVLVSAFYQGKDNLKFEEAFQRQTENAIRVLKKMFENLEQDSDLMKYARARINQIMRKEFMGQIQPAQGCEEDSGIELEDEGTECVKLTIRNNEIVEDGKPVHYASVRKAYFIDDPFVLDGKMMTSNQPQNRFGFINKEERVLDSSAILTHRNRLAVQIRNYEETSPFEQMILDQNLKDVREKLNGIVPGSYEFTNAGDYYVENGVRLRMSNLATGSKLFSIIRILLDQGELNEKTLLILDEPEAHLHPEWKNEFAEVIALLVKELGVKVLLTTHSASFVMAIDAFVRKYELAQVTHFYQTKMAETGNDRFECADDHLGDVYQEFLDYLAEAKALRDQYL